MSDFKVGDTVKIINPAHPNYGVVTKLVKVAAISDWVIGGTTTSEARASGLKDPAHNVADNSDLELVRDTVDIKKQTIIRVSGNNMIVQHVTNTKKKRLSIQAKRGLKFSQIDELIELLTKLKEEVNAAG